MSESNLPRRVQWRVNFFVPYFRRWMSRSFHAVRLSKTGHLPATEGKPVLVVMNHPSWWDPLFGFVLSTLLPGYHCYAPIDAKALAQLQHGIVLARQQRVHADSRQGGDVVEAIAHQFMRDEHFSLLFGQIVQRGVNLIEKQASQVQGLGTRIR